MGTISSRSLTSHFTRNVSYSLYYICLLPTHHFHHSRYVPSNPYDGSAVSQLLYTCLQWVLGGNRGPRTGYTCLQSKNGSNRGAIWKRAGSTADPAGALEGPTSPNLFANCVAPVYQRLCTCLWLLSKTRCHESCLDTIGATPVLHLRPNWFRAKQFFENLNLEWDSTCFLRAK